jgi:signal transduction histidine kinase
VRTTIFALDPPVPPSVGIRNRVIELCSRVSGSLGFEPEVRFAGAIDGRIDEVISTELLSTLREGLSNVIRHAGATHVEVVLTADDDICLRVSDDGVGVDPEADRSGPKGRGLANMAERGTALGGSLTVSPRSGGGTDLVWTVPSAH